MLQPLKTRADAAVDRMTDFMARTPRRRWVRNLFRGMQEHQDMRAASSMAFHLFLAMIPMVAFVGWVAARVVDQSPDALARVTLLLDVTPGEVQDVFRQQMGRLTDSVAMAPIALLGMMWLTSGAFHTVMTVLEQALHAPRRPWWKKRLIGAAGALTAMTAIPLLGWLAVEISGGPMAVLHRFYTGQPDDKRLQHWLALGIAAVMCTMLVAAFFRVAVSRPGVKRRVWPGAIMSVSIGATASLGFTAYARELARYTVFYGSLAAVAVLLIWLWILCMALLLGAELNAQLEGLEREEHSARNERARAALTPKPHRPPQQVTSKSDEPKPTSSGGNPDERAAFES